MSSAIPAVEVSLAPAGRAAEIALLLGHYLAELGSNEEYPYLPLYWAEDTRFAYLIHLGTETVGFALVRILSDRPIFQMAEFYVLPHWRRLHVGRQAANLLFERHPGAWEIPVLAGNAAAHAFWSSVAALRIDREVFTEEGNVGTVFCHESKASPSGA